MRTLLSSSMLVAALAATGCVGTLDPADPPQVDAGDVDAPIAASAGRRAFDRDVATNLANSCGGGACHEGTGSPLKFLGTTSPDDNYDVITSTAHTQLTGGYNPGSAMLLLKGAHQSVPAWPTAQADLIRGWLVQEAMDRGIDTTNPPVPPVPTGPLTSRQALAQFSACMQYADWTTTQMYTWADKGSNNGDCSTCHGDSAGLFNTNDDDTMMFDMNRKELFIKSFFGVGLKDIAQPELGYKVIVNAQKFINKGTGNGNSHPNFTYTNDNTYRPRLEQFYMLTQNAITANTGGCASGSFPVEP